MLSEAGFFLPLIVLWLRTKTKQIILPNQSKMISPFPHFQFFSCVSEPKHPIICSGLISNIYQLVPVIKIGKWGNNRSGSTLKKKSTIYMMVLAEYHCGGLTLAGCQVPTKASLSFPSSTGQGRENMTKGSQVEIRAERHHLLITIMGKTDPAWRN